MNETENCDHAEILDLLATAYEGSAEFYNFLLYQECQFLEACEPEFVEFIRGLPISHPEPDPSLMAEKAQPLLNRTSRGFGVN